MSILIKGMEMPDKCGCCRLFHAEYPMHCTAIKEYRTASAPYGMSRPDWCPLVEIKTPHGRLIDADELIRVCEAWKYEAQKRDASINLRFANAVIAQVKLQPTLIEAEGGQMKILFNLMTTIEVPDAEKFPPRKEVEKQLIDFFASEGMIAHGLEVTNYCVPAEEEQEE